MAESGYAGKILRIDLSDRKVSTLATSDYSDKYTGGRGIASKIYWDETGPRTTAAGPDNCLVLMTGPLAGFTRLAGSRLFLCGKSILTDPESYSYANMGGSWGAWLKFAGYDGLAVTGIAENPVYIYIQGGEKVEIRDASHLQGKTSIETEEMLKAEHGSDVRTIEIGPAAENLVTFATILGAENSSASGGLGATMGLKKLKAIVVKAEVKNRPVPADPGGLESLTKRIHELQTKNWEDYAHETWLAGKPSACYGCISGCTRHTYTAENNRKFKSFCQASVFYMAEAEKYFQGDSKDYRIASRLCDKYGLDTMVMESIIKWLTRCYDEGLISDKSTGIPVSRIGSPEFIEGLVKLIYTREGLGDRLAGGVLKAARFLGPDAEKLLYEEIETRGGEKLDYDPRIMLTNALTLATEPRRPIQQLHGISYPYIRWINWHDGFEDSHITSNILKEIAGGYWGSLEAIDFTQYSGKALAAKTIQDYNYAKECLILCDMVWPIYLINLRDETLRPGTLESQLVKAVTGKEMDEAGLFTLGERCVNVQRAILISQGWKAREDDTLLPYFFEEPLQSVFYSPDCLIPDAEGNFTTRRNVVVERDRFEKMKDEYYSLRGWDEKTGLQTGTELKRLGLEDIADRLRKIDRLK